MEQFLLMILGLFLTPLFLLILLIVVPGCFGITLGLRHLYTNFLLRLFESSNRFGADANLKPVDELTPDFDELDDADNEDNADDINNEGVFVPSTKNVLIKKDSNKHLADGIKSTNSHPNGKRSLESIDIDFQFSDACYFLKKGVEAIIDDEVTKRFTAEELTSWNLLTRTSMRYQYLNVRLTLLWMGAFIFRYFLLLPVRLAVTIICMLYLLVSSAFLGYMPDSRDNKAKGGICVANHTSPIDIAILSCDNVYAFIGQLHSGFLGMMQRAMSRTGTDHIWFERSEMRDRQKVTQRLKEHVEDPKKLPILIFPEGTCINNTSVMQFKKGSFEVGGIIYPVAIKYNSTFGDPFWNSSKYSMVRYLLMMMTSWAIVCDVWYLPPVTREEGEASVDFANRVKAAIAKQGGLLDLIWDGQLKRTRVKSFYRAKEQEEYSKIIKTE